MTKEQIHYENWLRRAVDDPDLITELNEIAGNDVMIRDRFYTDLVFGTAGLRGVIGAGTCFINVYTIGRATQGYSDYLNATYENPSVAIAFDSRIKSKLFAKRAAEVFAANGIKVYIFPELQPTPVLSFAVRSLKAQGGVVITASHNPSKYNGYKAYGPDGCQLTIEAADAVLANIEKIPMFGGAAVIPFDQGLDDGTIEYIPGSLLEDFLNEIKCQSINPDILKSADLKVVYTPLNGTGNKPVRAALDTAGVKQVFVVPEQEHPDGNFPTAPYPNPEIREAFERAIKLSEQVKPDLLLATDPDCDRVGIAVCHGGEYVLMSGNEVGCMLLYYILSQRTEKGTLPKNPIAIKTIVTTPLVNMIAQKFGCEVIDVLTGFKFIGEQIGFLEEKGEANRYVFGFEESYGYLAGTYVRDKDAVVASLLICEMAAYYKEHGKTLYDLMNEIYSEYGYYINAIVNFTCEGESGMERMDGIMSALRENSPVQIGGLKVRAVADYLISREYLCCNDEFIDITLPKSNVIQFKLSGGTSAIVRPSGTEPKIKVYVASKGSSKADAEIIANSVKADFTKLLGF